ncbi:MAG: hypothetical protein RIR52_643 [Acidobacteriota bacterium]
MMEPKSVLRGLVMSMILMGAATTGLASPQGDDRRLSRPVELIFFQPGGERVTRPFGMIVQIQNGPRGTGGALGGNSKVSVKDGRHLLSVTTGSESMVRLLIEGDGRRTGNTIAFFRIGTELTVYPVFLAPVTDEASGGLRRFRPGTADLDSSVVGEAKAAFELALRLVEERRFEAALGQFTRALQLAPRFPGALNQLGLLYHQQGRIDEAVSAFTQAVTIGDRAINPYLNLGVSLNRLGRYGESIAILTSLLEANPTTSRIRIPLAEALVQSQQWDAAVEIIGPAISDIGALPPELQSESRYILARTMFREERYRSAVRELTRAIASSTSWTNTPEAWLLLGISHYELKQDQEAESALLKAFELGGKRMAEAQYRLAQLYFRQNKTEKAARALEVFMRDVEPGARPDLMREARALQGRIRGVTDRKPGGSN